MGNAAGLFVLPVGYYYKKIVSLVNMESHFQILEAVLQWSPIISDRRISFFFIDASSLCFRSPLL